MSLGYLGNCKLVVQDDNIALYSYSGENWNDKNSKSGDIELLDGVLCIFKKCLEEPEIYTKVKKLPSGKRKTFEKRIVHTPSIVEHILEEQIIIEKKCKNEFKRETMDGVECYIAHMLLRKIFTEYQENGVIPEKTAFIQ
jgi:hypothetical protein